MKAFIGVTDHNWFNFLSNQQNLEEINFWQPSGKSTFQVLNPGELFLFKLHSPNNFIVGGGFFAHSTTLPISLAWEAFGFGNGALSLHDMKAKVTKYRSNDSSTNTDFHIGCILLEQPFFLSKELWIPVPSNWAPNIVRGKTYDLTIEPGLTIWNQIQTRITLNNMIGEEKAKYGDPILSFPRLGQGTFRVLVTDEYERKCAISNERTLPALDAAHIKPYSENGKHEISNGILLRRDIHALFDKGYITITPLLHIEVSRKIKEEYENGRDYYKHHGNLIRLPRNPINKPKFEYLEWHNNNVFKG